jgi:MFS family permease
MTAALTKTRSNLVFATLFAIESFCRSLNATVLPVQAYELLGSSSAVSRLSVGVSLVVLATTLMLPVFFGKLRRRWAYSIGVTGLMLAAGLLATHTLPGQISGTYLRSVSASLLSVTLSLYLMDYVGKRELVRAESLRLTLATLSWMAGPVLGITLYEKFGPQMPQLLAAFTGACLLLTFWYFKLNEPELLPAGTMQKINPFANVKHFIRQPRLRLSWSVAFGRSCFWMTLFVYGPIVLVEGGASKQFAGIIISLSQASLFFAVFYGTLARRFGIRVVVTFCLALSGAFALAACLVDDPNLPYFTAGFLLAGSFACVGLDAVGGVPFLRFVKPRERHFMAPVYRTYIDLSELIPSIVYAFALLYFSTPIVFGLLGSFLFILAGVTWQHVPKSM